MKCPKCNFENPADTLYCGKCGTRLDSAEKISFSQTKTLETTSEELTRSTTFAGRYEVIEELGKGGMGKVYRVFDTRIKEEVALKLLKPEIAADKKTIERFSNELKFARKIIHKNVCRMHDLHEQKGIPYITMEYVPGEDLKSLIRRTEKLTVGKAIAIAKQVCEGLAEAHKLGVIHRDLKPQNIMIDREGNARIMDFGIARSLETKGITGEGVIIGTPEYMSPEQVEGEEADQRSDIYSLGVILYEMVTGRVPFGGETPLSIAVKHKSETPTAPRQINLQIPEDLNSVILRCMEKDKERRFQTAEELLSGLSGIEKALPTTERVVSERKPEKAFRNIRPYIFSATILLAAVVIVVGYFLYTRREKAERPASGLVPEARWEHSIAVLPFRDLSPNKDQEHLCYGMTEAINDRLVQVEDLKVSATGAVIRYKETEKTLREIGEELGVVNILEGSIQKEGDRIRVRAQLINADSAFQLWSQTYERTRASLFDIQDEISQSITETLKIKFAPETLKSAKSAHPQNIDAYEYYMKGMHFIKSKFVVSFQEEDFQAGLEMFQKAIEINPDYALAYFGLAWAYEHHYHVTGSEKDVEQSMKACETAYRLDPDSAMMNALMGYYYYEYKTEYDKAFQFHKKALEINPNIGEVNFLVGVCYLYHGLYEQGIPYLLKAIELDPYYFWSPYKLAMCYMNTGEFEKAAFYFEKYFELAPFILIFPGYPTALYIRMKKYDRVEELLARTEKAAPDYWGIPYCRALLLAAKGEKDKALALHRNSEVYALLGMKDEAIESLNKEIRGRVQFPHIFYLDLLNNPFFDNMQDHPSFREIVKREKKVYEEHLKKYGSQPSF